MTLSSQRRRWIGGYGLCGGARVGIGSCWDVCLFSLVTTVELLTLEGKMSASFIVMSCVVGFLMLQATSNVMLAKVVVRGRHVRLSAQLCRTTWSPMKFLKLDKECGCVSLMSLPTSTLRRRYFWSRRWRICFVVRIDAVDDYETCHL